MRIFGVVLTLLIGPLLASEPSDSDVKEKIFGSEEVALSVRDAEKVEVCLLRHIPPPGAKAAGKGERYEEMDYLLVEPAAAKRLQSALLDPKNYYWGGGLKACWPRYGLRMRLTQGAKITTIDFCMLCKILVVTQEGKIMGGKSFDPGVALFQAEFAKIFPKQEIR